MITHPSWCLGPPVCSAGQKARPGLRPLHRGQPHQVPGTAGAVTASLIQEPDGPARVAVTSNGWAHSRTTEFNPTSIDVLIAELMKLADEARAGQVSGPSPASM